MGRIIELRADSAAAQIAGFVPPWFVLPGNLLGREREVKILPERISHIHERRRNWLTFCLTYIPDVLARPDYLGQAMRGDRRRVEFVRLVGRPTRWLLVSVKFVDERREAWVNSAYPVADAYLTRRVRKGSLSKAGRGP